MVLLPDFELSSISEGHTSTLCRFTFHFMHCYSEVLEIDARLCVVSWVIFSFTSLCIWSFKDKYKRGIYMNYLSSLILSPNFWYAISFEIKWIRFIRFKEAWMSCMSDICCYWFKESSKFFIVLVGFLGVWRGYCIRMGLGDFSW